MTAIFEETQDVNRRLNSDILSGRGAAPLGLPSARGAAITESEWTRRYFDRQWATSSLRSASAISVRGTLTQLPRKPVVIRRCASTDEALNARCSIPTMAAQVA